MNFKNIILQLCLVAGLTACGTSFDGPSEDEIKNALLIDLPEGYQVDSLTLEAATNVGDEIEPEFRSRSSLELSLSENFFQRSGEINEKPIVKLVAEKGKTVSGVLITQSKPVGEGWEVKIEQFKSPKIAGRPESEFGVSGYIIENSDQHKDAIKEREARLDSLEKQTERAQEKLRNKFIGTLKSVQPTLVNGDVYTRRNRELGFELVLYPMTGESGTGNARVYSFGEPKESVSAAFEYYFNIDDEINLKFNKRVDFRALGFYTNPKARWRLTPTGRFTTKVGRAEWFAQLRKK